MLGLVPGSNLLVMFIAGRASGSARPADRVLVQEADANDAGKKAFVVNRIGDVAFILAGA